MAINDVAYFARKREEGCGGARVAGVWDDAQRAPGFWYGREGHVCADLLDIGHGHRRVVVEVAELEMVDNRYAAIVRPPDPKGGRRLEFQYRALIQADGR